jgi:hypothetical protein
MPFMDITTASKSDTKRSFKYGKLVLIFFHQLFWNRLLPNELITIRNHGDDEEDEREIKSALESVTSTFYKNKILST